MSAGTRHRVRELISGALSQGRLELHPLTPYPKPADTAATLATPLFPAMHGQVSMSGVARLLSAKTID